jgi:ribonuclease HIII
MAVIGCPLRFYVEEDIEMSLEQQANRISSYFQENEVDFETREIPYGRQFLILDGNVRLNCYSGKKGFSFHVQGKDKVLTSELEEEIGTLLGGGSPQKQKAQKKSRTQVKPASDQMGFSRSYDFPWMGSDESGKGDYFGPIVCAGVVLDPENDSDTLTRTLQDSKRLSDARIEELAPKIRALGTARFKVLTLKPQAYNDLYTQFKSQKKNLNHLLAWMHGTVIKELMERNSSLRLAVVDQFAREQYMTTAIKGIERKFTLVQRSRGEENLAVAAASILARDALIQWHLDEKKRLGYALPKGAGHNTIFAGRRYVSSFGDDALGEVAKLHFKTTAEVLG